MFSAILSAFLIFALQLQRPLNTTLVLWFLSLAASLIGALFVMLSKSLTRWTINEKRAEAIFSTPELLRRRYQEIKRIYVHAIFESEFSLLTAIASFFIYVALVLFFVGLVVFLYTTQRRIGIIFLSITSTIGVFIIGIAYHNYLAFHIN